MFIVKVFYSCSSLNIMYNVASLNEAFDNVVVMSAVLPLETEYTDDEGVRFTLDTQPPSSRAVSITGSYHCSWKPCSNHFQSYADFKPKGT